jgi:alpha-tubulin suppressor-like RCC1 family protein
VHAAVPVVAGLVVTVTAGAVPALAAWQLPSAAASHIRPPATRPHALTSRMAQGAHWAHIDTGYGYSCGIHADGTLWCWGSIGNFSSQDLPQQVTTPAREAGPASPGGEYQTCATRTDGTLWCWGNNEDGDLGIGNNINQDRPRQVTGCRWPVTSTPPARTSADKQPHISGRAGGTGCRGGLLRGPRPGAGWRG